MWFTFNQNNTGGSFDIDEETGEYMVVEGDTLDEAFDRCTAVYEDPEFRLDCECCGNRWSRYAWGTHETLQAALKELEESPYLYSWDSDPIRVWFADGRVLKGSEVK